MNKSYDSRKARIARNCSRPNRSSDGNAFVLMGMASKFARQLGIDKDEVINENDIWRLRKPN